MVRFVRVKSHIRRGKYGISRVRSHKRRLHSTIPFRGQRNVMRLPIRSSIIVPSTTGKNKPVSNKEFNNRIVNTKKFLSNTQGGYTSVKAQGGYTDDKGRLIKEKVAVVESYSTKKDYRKNKPKIERYLRKKAKDWGQESVGYEYEDDLYVVRPKR